VDTRATARSLSDGRAAVGAAAHAALGRGAPARPWIACGAACDAVDLPLTLLDRLPRGARRAGGRARRERAAMAAALER